MAWYKFQLSKKHPKEVIEIADGMDDPDMWFLYHYLMDHDLQGYSPVYKFEKVKNIKEDKLVQDAVIKKVFNLEKKLNYYRKQLDPKVWAKYNGGC